MTATCPLRTLAHPLAGLTEVSGGRTGSPKGAARPCDRVMPAKKRSVMTRRSGAGSGQRAAG
ncbi:hypothetical protein PV392_26010 [Streptomyces sp. ME03-5709C]|nr:hypothetical protein [Streptomyces sp. ME03-5709C]